MVLLRPILAEVARRGRQPVELVRAAGLDPVVLADPDGTVEAARVKEVWQAAAELTGDDCFGLHMGEEVVPGTYELLDFLAWSANNIAEATDRLARYFRVLAGHARVEMDGEAIVVTPLAGEGPGWRQCVECNLSLQVSYLRRAFAEPGWAPRELEFAHPAPRDVSEHARVFRAPVRFSRPRNLLRLSPRDLERQVVTANPALGRLLAEYADGLLARLPDGDSFEARVRGAIREQLAGGRAPGIDDLARALAMSRRSMQRKLGEAGRTHRELVDDGRRELARALLERADLPVAEVAFRLGFARTNAFHRAFRRWEGMTPVAFRAAALHLGQADRRVGSRPKRG